MKLIENIILMYCIKDKLKTSLQSGEQNFINIIMFC
jgi:hypothetical protein